MCYRHCSQYIRTTTNINNDINNVTHACMSGQSKCPNVPSTAPSRLRERPPPMIMCPTINARRVGSMLMAPRRSYHATTAVQVII